MTDLGNTLVRAAPSVPVNNTVETYKNSEGITVQVTEPSINDTLHSNYRIPQRDLSNQERPKVQRLSKKKAAVLADKVAKLELKRRKKNVPLKKRFCSICNISCNGPKPYQDHIRSRSHRTQVENKKSIPRCIPCNRTFESHGHLNRHRNGLAHLKLVAKLSN